MRLYTIGIIPTIEGAIAVLNNEGKLVEVLDMPSKSRTALKQQVDGHELHKELKSYDPQQTHVYIQKRASVFGKKPTDMYNSGEGMGVIKGVIETLGIPYSMVSPQVWKRHHALIGHENDMARITVLKKYPASAEYFRVKKYCDRADALLLAEFGLNYSS